jgi:putative ABC transport system ATP-binding protein
MITINGLQKIYYTDEIKTIALNNIDLHISQGEFVSIMGPSGCGKTTLLNIIGMLDKFDKGKYIFRDNDISGYNENKLALLRKNNIGFIFQNYNLIDNLTVYENIELPLVYLKKNKSDIKRSVLDVLNKLEISNRKNHFPFQLSGGQQQRTAIARAIVYNPGLILADEPTGNLDSKNGEDIMKILSLLSNEGKTIIMVTHSQEYAQWSQRLIRLFDGTIIADENSKNLIRLR